MTEDQNALLIFSEELAEVAAELLLLQNQVSKAIRFGLGEKRDLPITNFERIAAEWNDLLGSIEVLATHGINLTPDITAITAKMEKIERYTNYSIELGQVTPNPPQEIKPITEINWDEAPEGTERYNGKLDYPWLKRDRFGRIWSHNSRGRWNYWNAHWAEASWNEATARYSDPVPASRTEQGKEVEQLKAEIAEHKKLQEEFAIKKEEYYEAEKQYEKAENELIIARNLLECHEQELRNSVTLNTDSKGEGNG